VSRSFSQPEVRDAVVSGYMGLVKQIDDSIGDLMAYLRDSGLMEQTLIVFCSDHGDYLGDHWLGEKEFFHEPSIRTPLIIVDPDSRADATRGTRCDSLVESVDLLPTFLDVYGGPAVPHVVDGRSLRPILFGATPADWREVVVSEYDYSFQDARLELQTPPRECWLRMIFDGRWKYILAEGYRPMLFDLAQDPHEHHDLGASEATEHVAARQRMHEKLFEWARQPRQRVTVPDGLIATTEVQARITESGVLIGYIDEKDLIKQRKTFKPRFASSNPLVKRTLDRLTQPIAPDRQEDLA
ncbi:MAG: sulfatase-like hydrolase/transferase, partial [Hylemonella sp.]